MNQTQIKIPWQPNVPDRLATCSKCHAHTTHKSGQCKKCRLEPCKYCKRLTDSRFNGAPRCMRCRGVAMREE